MVGIGKKNNCIVPPRDTKASVSRGEWRRNTSGSVIAAENMVSGENSST